MKTYKVIASLTTYFFQYVEANSADEAYDIAKGMDGGQFIPVDQGVGGDWAIDSAYEADKPSCLYCGGNCPNDEDHACDGYSGDIDGLYSGGADHD
jgi:hypothetical protein